MRWYSWTSSCSDRSRTAWTRAWSRPTWSLKWFWSCWSWSKTAIDSRLWLALALKSWLAWIRLNWAAVAVRTCRLTWRAYSTVYRSRACAVSCGCARCSCSLWQLGQGACVILKLTLLTNYYDTNKLASYFENFNSACRFLMITYDFFYVLCICYKSWTLSWNQIIYFSLILSGITFFAY